MPEEKVVPEKIEKALRSWRRHAQTWERLLYVLAVAGIVCSLVVTTFVDTLELSSTRVLAFISAVSVAVISGFNIGKRAANYRTAWRHLNVACMRYGQLKTFTEKQLIEAYEEGERIIGNIEIHP